MQFKYNENLISYSEFSAIFPTEANYLTGQLDKFDLTFEAQNELIALKFQDFSPIKIEIDKAMAHHKSFFTKNSLYKDPLAKALGIKKGKARPSIWDATAGMMNDSMLIKSYGIADLTLFERNPVVCVLIENALKHTESSFCFKAGCALDYPELSSPEVIYFDPMYKDKSSKAAPKKEMAIFRSVVAADEDAYDIACRYQSIATERLVIKRSVKVKSLLENPDFSIAGKSTAYDVYLSI